MMRITTVQDLQTIKDQTTRLLSIQQGGHRVKVNFHMGTCGLAAGANQLHALISENRKKLKILESPSQVVQGFAAKAHSDHQSLGCRR
jgi:hypothetical protein